jgi:hypothetical protein
MADDTPEARFLDDVTLVSLADLCEATGLSMDELAELVAEGALEPAQAAAPLFDSHALVVARAASRVRREFALDDVHSVCVVLRFVERVKILERELVALRARIGRD